MDLEIKEVIINKESGLKQYSLRDRIISGLSSLFVIEEKNIIEYTAPSIIILENWVKTIFGYGAEGILEIGDRNLLKEADFINIRDDNKYVNKDKDYQVILITSPLYEFKDYQKIIFEYGFSRERVIFIFLSIGEESRIISSLLNNTMHCVTLDEVVDLRKAYDSEYSIAMQLSCIVNNQIKK